MNQKHMDSISLGIHMGLKTKGAGENAFGEEHFRSHQTPCICKQQFEVCDDCVLGWVPFLIIECTGCLAAASQMCPKENKYLWKGRIQQMVFEGLLLPKPTYGF